MTSKPFLSIHSLPPTSFSRRKAFPLSNFCGQSGYEPMSDPATPNAWKDAWTVEGYCDDSIDAAPSSSNLDSTTTVIGRPCPNRWSASEEYEAGDRVSVTVTSDPLHQNEYVCKSWPESEHCDQYGPSQGLLGALGENQASCALFILLSFIRFLLNTCPSTNFHLSP